MAICLGISGQVVCGLDILPLCVKCFYFTWKFREGKLLLFCWLEIWKQQLGNSILPSGFILRDLVFLWYLSYNPSAGACDASAIQVHDRLAYSLMAFPAIKIWAIRLKYQNISDVTTRKINTSNAITDFQSNTWQFHCSSNFSPGVLMLLLKFSPSVWKQALSNWGTCEETCFEAWGSDGRAVSRHITTAASLATNPSPHPLGSNL